MPDSSPPCWSKHSRVPASLHSIQPALGVLGARVGSGDNYWGYFVNLAPSFGVLAVLYFIVMAALTGLAVYVLILVITFLRLRIAELRRAAPPAGDTRQQ